MSLGGGSNNQSTTNTIAQPPAFQVPYIERMLGEAMAQYESPAPQYYPGNTLAPVNQLQQQALAGMTDYAGGAAQGLFNNMYNAQNFQLNQAVDPLSNPFFHSTAQAMIRPATQALTQQVLPQINQGSVVSGNYGGSRQGVAQGSAINNWQQNVLDTLSNFGTNAYNKGLDIQSRAIAMAPQTRQAGLFPSQVYSSAGDWLRQQEQGGIDAEIARWNYEQNLPAQKLNQFASLVGNPLGTQTTQQADVSRSNPYLAAGGGALTGYALSRMLPEAMAGFSPYAAGIGALLGYFGS